MANHSTKNPARTVTGEQRERRVKFPSGNRYEFIQSWHTLDNGDHFHYIHVFKNGAFIPAKRFSWVTKGDGTFVKMLYPEG